MFGEFTLRTDQLPERLRPDRLPAGNLVKRVSRAQKKGTAPGYGSLAALWPKYGPPKSTKQTIEKGELFAYSSLLCSYLSLCLGAVLDDAVHVNPSYSSIPGV